jgi:hypothetical protein
MLMFLKTTPLINVDGIWAAAQVVTIVIVIVAIAYLGREMIRAASGSTRSNNPGSSHGEQSSREFGSFYVVAFGITAVFFGFIVMLLFADTFTDNISTALGFLTALFGAITGLVGTYFGVKSSSDARQGAQELASGTRRTATVTITPSEDTAFVNTAHTVTATVLTAGGQAAAAVHVTFAVTSGPDSAAIHPTVVATDSSGQATFTVTNGGQPGTDTIEATALGGRGTATVNFREGPRDSEKE